MSETSETDPAFAPWLRFVALAFVVAALGLPINDLFRYALLLLATIPIFVGTISRRLSQWIAAISIVVLTIATQWLPLAPRIEEGHNIFIVGGRPAALERGLPADASRQMSAEFNASYPSERRCDPKAFGCWHRAGFPDRAYAFSSDGIYSGALYSRQVTGIDFSDPVWLRLGFINEIRYNWGGTSDLQRGKREPWWKILHPWRLTMPHFVMYIFPPNSLAVGCAGGVSYYGKRQMSDLPRRAIPNPRAGQLKPEILAGASSAFRSIPHLQ